eukprot:5232431-Amphidinium_carterae.1
MKVLLQHGTIHRQVLSMMSVLVEGANVEELCVARGTHRGLTQTTSEWLLFLVCMVIAAFCVTAKVPIAQIGGEAVWCMSHMLAVGPSQK